MTPEQMRALADRATALSQRRHSPMAVLLREHVTALRAAADQLEAVQRYVRDGEVEDDNGRHVVYTYGLASLLGLTADTAPQEDRDE